MCKLYEMTVRRKILTQAISWWGQAPEVDGQVLIVGGDVQVHTIQTVRITKGHAYDLVGEVVAGGAEAAVRQYERTRR